MTYQTDSASGLDVTGTVCSEQARLLSMVRRIKRTPTEMSLKAENPQSDQRYQQCANRDCRLRHPVRLLYYLNGRRRFHRIG